VVAGGLAVVRRADDLAERKYSGSGRTKWNGSTLGRVDGVDDVVDVGRVGPEAWLEAE
jgi:hypothetical protein